MKNSMKIIEIKNNNIESHAKLFVEIFTQAPWLEEWTVEGAYKSLKCYQQTPNFIGFSVFKEKELIAFLFGNIEPYQKGNIYLLKEMCVKEAYQSKGIGQKLMKTLDEKLQKENISSVILLTQKGTPAEKFYAYNGYTPSENIRLYVKDF